MHARRAIPEVLYYPASGEGLPAFQLLGLPVEEVLLELEWVSHAHGRADTLRLVLDDREGLWADDVFPDQGARLGGRLRLEGWPEAFGGRPADGRALLEMGLFEIDRFVLSRPPRTAQIGGLSAYVTTSMRTEERTQGWEDVSLQTIAEEIAARHDLTLAYEASTNPAFDRKEQQETPDLRFLRGLCEDYNLSLKIGGGTLVITDDAAMAALGAATIQEAMVDPQIATPSEYELSNQAWDLVRACEVAFDDPLTDSSVILAKAVDARVPTGETLQLNERISSPAQAQLRARAALARRNREETVATLTMLGHPACVAGVAVDLTGFGTLSGTYIIEQSTHRLTRAQGYTTTCALRKRREPAEG